MKQIDPSELKPHPAIKNLPRWDDDDPRFLNLCDDVRDHGIRVPLLITADNQIVDGVIRWRAAKRRQLKLVPCDLLADGASIPIAAMQLLLQRKHYTKGTMAYVVFPLLDAAVSAKAKSNIGSPLAGRHIIDTAQGLAESVGIGRSTYFIAQSVHKLFAEHPELKAEYEPKIMEGDSKTNENIGMGLGAAHAGMAAKLKDNKSGGGPKAPDRQFELFTEGLRAIETRLSFWEKFDLGQKEKAVASIRRTVSVMPDDLIHEWERAIKLRKRQAMEASA